VTTHTQESGTLGEETGGRNTRAAWLAWSVCGLTLALDACALALAALNRGDVQEVTFPFAITVSAVVGGLVASRRPKNPVGWYFLGSAACFALVGVANGYATYGLITAPGALLGARAVAWLLSWLWLPGVMLLLCFLPLYFPDGRLLSHRWRWVVWLALFFSVTGAIYLAFRPGEMQSTGIINPLGIEALLPVLGLLDTLTGVPYFPILFASVASLVVRFRRSGSVERQQIKWLAFAALVIPVWFLTNAPIEAAAPSLFLLIDSLIFASLPVAAGVAILRHRLYDIDVLINRTLVYGALTVSLVLVYLGNVVLLQRIFVTLTAQGSQLAIVASTLAIAALFNPLRRRIQAFIDRRFYRHKYDAAKTLAQFSSRLRDETDLDALNEEMVTVVRETLQPAYVSLWLRSAPERGDGEEPAGPAAERGVPGSL
jgi:hypothetical protein